MENLRWQLPIRKRSAVLRKSCRVIIAETLESRRMLSVVPNGFSDTAVGSAITSATTMSIAPDGRIFVATQTGAIRVIDHDVLQAQPFITLNVNSVGDNGILSVAFDPNFATNKYVYVNYITGSAPIHSRISRFSAAADTVAANTEVDLFDRETQSNTPHQSGLMAFGADGKLYITAGDEDTSSNSQSMANTRGKLLRINADGSIPSDNPFYSSAIGINRAIYSIGLRNPYGLAVEPTTGRIFISDVGENTWEEVDVAAPGANFGWPSSEGPTSKPGETGPLYAYDHSHGAAIVGAAFYSPQTSSFPAIYANQFFYSDFVANNILYFNPTVPPATNGATVFATGLSSPQDVDVSPDGSMYYLQRGGSGATTGSVHKIAFAAAASNTDYLSGLNPTSATNGWGPYERDKSNGEQAQGDGHTITLNGATYAKGLGVHAASELDYALGGAYARFQSDVGIDDEVGSAGNVTFQVVLDGKKLFDSGVMTGSSATQNVDLDVSGGKTLQLIVLTNGDSSSDHADWADAKFLRITTPSWLSAGPGAAYSLANNTLAITAGTVSLIGDASSTNPGLTVIVSGTAKIMIASTEHLGSLTLNDSSMAAAASNGNYVESVSGLTIGSTASFDLSNNALIIDYTVSSPAAAVRAQLISGRNGGTWNGSSGIISSAIAGAANSTLGYAEAFAILGPGGGTFAGQAVDGTAVLVRFTYLGDANLDRNVNVSDLGLLATGYGNSNAVFSQGDFNYDGKVDVTDLGLLATNYGKNLTLPAALPAASGKTLTKVQRV